MYVSCVLLEHFQHVITYRHVVFHKNIYKKCNWSAFFIITLLESATLGLPAESATPVQFFPELYFLSAQVPSRGAAHTRFYWNNENSLTWSSVSLRCRQVVLENKMCMRRKLLHDRGLCVLFWYFTELITINCCFQQVKIQHLSPEEPTFSASMIFLSSSWKLISLCRLCSFLCTSSQKAFSGSDPRLLPSSSSS